MMTSSISRSSLTNETVRVLYRMSLLLLLAGLISGSCLTVTPTPGTVTDTPTQTRTPTPTPTSTVSPAVVSVTYYVDSSMGSDAYSCAQAQNPATPKKTVSGVMSCDPGAGETVAFRGEFKETIFPNRSGTVLYDIQNIAGVDGSAVTFSQTIADLNPATDYVSIYGSRRGNSGAFAVRSVSGNQVVVDTSDLPGGQFISEADSDPGELQAAILRPVRFTAWEENDPPVWSGLYQTYHAVNQRVIMVSHLKSIAGEVVNPGYPVWPAFEIDGSDQGNSDFQIFDHLEVVNAECAIAIEAHIFQSNYNIIQYNNLHDIGTPGNASDEVIYLGFAYRPDLHHDYMQVMYNIIGPHNAGAVIGDGIDIKPSAHHATIFGNEIVGIEPLGCDDAPIKVAGADAFVANNYIHDIAPRSSKGCGISVVDKDIPGQGIGGQGAILVNNILADIRGVGIRVLDADNVQILNNTIYNIFPEPNCDSACMELSMGIGIWNWQGSTENIVIKNNIVQQVHIGIGRYIWSNNYPVSIDSDYNLIFDAVFAFRGTIRQNVHDLVADPGLVDPLNRNFALTFTSPARGSGTDLTTVFHIDDHDAADPKLPEISAPVIRTGDWDRGAFEREEE